MEVLPAFFVILGIFFGRIARFVKVFSIFAKKIVPMTSLNELLDELYAQATTECGQPSMPTVEPDATTPNEPDGYVERLRRVLVEMSQLLDPDEQPRLDSVPPSDEVCLRILNHWEQLGTSLSGIREHIESLDRDISLMQPWGDFDVMKVEQLAAKGIYVHFWRIEVGKLPPEADVASYVEHQARVVSQDAQWVYFVTVDDEPTPGLVAVGAEAVEVCPCPISTLIMLQTRDKDSLRRIETLRGDYALAHFDEVYAALRQALPPDQPMPQLQPEHIGLRQKIARIFTGKGKP